MTRFAIDADVVERLLRENRSVSARHQLVAPASVRSEILARLYREVRAGSLDEKEGRARLETLAGLKMRLLADRVSRATAWKIAAGLGWDEIGTAEYLAVATLQADAMVTDDADLVAASAGLIPLAGYDELFADNA